MRRHAHLEALKILDHAALGDVRLLQSLLQGRGRVKTLSTGENLLAAAEDVKRVGDGRVVGRGHGVEGTGRDGEAIKDVVVCTQKDSRGQEVVRARTGGQTRRHVPVWYFSLTSCPSRTSARVLRSSMSGGSSSHPLSMSIWTPSANARTGVSSSQTKSSAGCAILIVSISRRFSFETVAKICCVGRSRMARVSEGRGRRDRGEGG